jgi:hypothetical protein
VGEAFRTYWEKRTAYRLMVGSPEGKAFGFNKMLENCRVDTQLVGSPVALSSVELVS